jgi:hypothetical protein
VRQALDHNGHSPKSQELTMTDHRSAFQPRAVRQPWNKGKLIGAKPSLRRKQIFPNLRVAGSNPAGVTNKINVLMPQASLC